MGFIINAICNLGRYTLKKKKVNFATSKLKKKVNFVNRVFQKKSQVTQKFAARGDITTLRPLPGYFRALNTIFGFILAPLPLGGCYGTIYHNAGREGVQPPPKM